MHVLHADIETLIEIETEGKASRRGVAVAENLSLNVLVVSAQVVVVDAGANDFNSGSAEPGWSAAYRSFLLQVTHSATLHPYYAMNIVNKTQIASTKIASYYIGRIKRTPNAGLGRRLASCWLADLGSI